MFEELLFFGTEQKHSVREVIIHETDVNYF